MIKLMEMFSGGKSKEKETEPISKEPTFEDLLNSLPNEELKNEMSALIKEVSGEGGPPVGYFKGNYDDLLPEQRRYNELLGIARKEYFGIGEEVQG
jgi:UDP-2,3-diacylglucosamine pyrophosphatase LpxH